MAGSISHNHFLLPLLLGFLIAAAVIPQSCTGARLPHNGLAAAPAIAGRPASANFEQVKSTKTAVDSAGHVAASMVTDPKAEAQTLLDDLFSGTWGAFIFKDNSGLSVESLVAEGSAELKPTPSEHAADEDAADDDGDDIGLLDDPVAVETKLDELPPDDIDDEYGDDDVAAADAAAVGRHVTATDGSSVHATAADGVSSSRKEGNHSGGLEHRRRQHTDRTVDGVRSHWRRGNDRATTNLLRSAATAEPADEVLQQSPSSPPQQQQQQQQQLLHHVVAFHVTEPEPEAHTALGEGPGHRAHRKSGAADDVEALMPLPSPSTRLTEHGLPIGQWGKFLPSVSEPTLLRRVPAAASGGHGVQHWVRPAPSRSSRTRRPPNPGGGGGLLPDGSGRVDEPVSPQVVQLAAGSTDSVSVPENRDVGSSSSSGGGGGEQFRLVAEERSLRQQQRRHQQPLAAHAGIGWDDRAKHPAHGGGQEEKSAVGHQAALHSATPAKEGIRGSGTAQRASGGGSSSSGSDLRGAAGAGAAATAAGELRLSPPPSAWISRSSSAHLAAQQQQQQRPGEHGGWTAEDDGWASDKHETAVGGDAGARTVAASRPVRVDRPKPRIKLEGRFVA